MVFANGGRGWQAVWLHLYLQGRPNVQPGGGEHVRHGRPGHGPCMERRYLTVAYLVDLWRARTEVLPWDGRLPDEPVTFIGIEAPEGLPDGSETISLGRLSS